MRTSSRRRVVAAAAVCMVLAGAVACSNESRDAPPVPSTSSTEPELLDVESLREALPERIRTSGELVVVTSAPFSPMEFTRNGELVGFDVDLIRKIGETLGLRVEIDQVAFPSLLATVELGRADVGARGLFDTREREERVDMVTYLRAGTQWARREGSDVDPHNACGRRVGAEVDTTQLTVELPAKSDACEVVGEPAIDIVEFDSETAAMTALTRGAVDAVSADSPVTLNASKESGGQIEPAGHAFDTLPYAFPVAEGSALGPVLVTVVQHLIDSGEMRRIAQRWGLERGVVHTSLLNAANH